MSKPHRVAVVCPDVRRTGGLRTVAETFLEVLEGSAEFEPVPISVSMTPNDSASRLVRRPSTWFGEPDVHMIEAGGRHWTHVGADIGEIEWLRYRGSARLKALLASVDLVQVVAGTPAWAYLARNSPAPVCLQVATMSACERQGRPMGSGLAGVWRRAMSWGTARLDERALRLPQHVLVENSSMMRMIEDAGVPGSLIYPGIDVAAFANGSEGRGHGPILAVGRLGDDRKDWPLLIRAYGHLRSMGGHEVPPLRIAGRGSLAPHAVTLIKQLGLSQHVTVLNDLPPDQLRRLYGTASMFVLTSKEEGLGLVVLEAMAASLPVVASDLVGTRESVIDEVTGYLVSRDVAKPHEAFAEKMNYLLERPSLSREFGANGKVRVTDVFSRRATEAQVLALYRNLLQ